MNGLEVSEQVWSKRLKSLDATNQLGMCLGKLSQPGDVICLYGDLGAGKTALSKGIALGLEVTENVTSPTYTLINEYTGRLPFYHLDLYRLCSEEEAYELGLEEYLYGNGVTVLEWPSRIADLLPRDRLEIELVKDPEADEERQIILRPQGARYLTLVEELESACLF